MSLLETLPEREATLLSMSTYFLLEKIEGGYHPSPQEIVDVLQASVYTRIKACRNDPFYQDALLAYDAENNQYTHALEIYEKYPQSLEAEENLKLCILAHVGTFGSFLREYSLLLQMLDTYLSYLSTNLMEWREKRDKDAPRIQWERLSQEEQDVLLREEKGEHKGEKRD